MAWGAMMFQNNKLFLLVFLSLPGCASLPRHLLNPATQDIADHFNEIIDKQIDSNIRRIAKNPNATPSYVTITTGTFQNTDSITPNLSFPLSANLETDTAPAAITTTTKIVQNGAGLTTSSETDTATPSPATSNTTKHTMGAQTLGLSAMAQWQQGWTATPLIDPDAIRRQKEIYRYFTGWESYVDFFDRYPIQKAAGSGINIVLYSKNDQNVNISQHVQYDVDPTYLRPPSCIFCVAQYSDSGINLSCTTKTINSIEEAQQEAAYAAQVKIQANNQKLTLALSVAQQKITSGTLSKLKPDDIVKSQKNALAIYELVAANFSDKIPSDDYVKSNVQQTRNYSGQICIYVTVNKQLMHRDKYNTDQPNSDEYIAKSAHDKDFNFNRNDALTLVKSSSAPWVQSGLETGRSYYGYAFGELVPFILEASSIGSPSSPSGTNGAGSGNPGKATPAKTPSPQAPTQVQNVGGSG
jgi:hypothetical protein